MHCARLLALLALLPALCCLIPAVDIALQGILSFVPTVHALSFTCKQEDDFLPRTMMGNKPCAPGEAGLQPSQNQLPMGACAPAASRHDGRPHSGCRYAARSAKAAASSADVSGEPKLASATAKVLHAVVDGQ